MIEHLYMHTNGHNDGHKHDLDAPWTYSIRSQIFCRNQEEYDYLSSLNLMHGREIEINIWDEWLKSRKPYMSLFDDKIKVESLRPMVLPIAYSTWVVNLRGM